VGGGLLKITQPLATEEFLNETRDHYECLLLADLVVPIYENTTEEVELSIEDQVNLMKGKLDKAIKEATKIMGGGEESSSTNDQQQQQQQGQGQQNDTSSEPPKETKRVSFRDKQAQRLAERKAKEAERELSKPKYRLGADCETLICGSCKAIVEEFAQIVYKAIRNPEIKYIDQLVPGLCESRGIGLKYREIVADICRIMDKVSFSFLLIIVICYCFVFLTQHRMNSVTKKH
jgi:hypothetical protein